MKMLFLTTLVFCAYTMAFAFPQHDIVATADAEDAALARINIMSDGAYDHMIDEARTMILQQSTPSTVNSPNTPAPIGIPRIPPMIPSFFDYPHHLRVWWARKRPYIHRYRPYLYSHYPRYRYGPRYYIPRYGYGHYGHGHIHHGYGYY